MADKINFNQNFDKLKDNEQPFSISSVYALSNMEPQDQARFEREWPAIPVERRRKITGAMVDLAEENIELVFYDAFFYMLQDADARVRGKAIEGLEEDETRELLARLLEIMSRDEDEIVREKAAASLSRFVYQAEMGNLRERWIERLRSGLLAQCEDDFRPVAVGRRALEALGYFGQDERVIRLIQQAYGSDDDLLQASALKAMGRSVNRRWLPEIGKELSSQTPELRYEAAYAAGEMGSEEMLQPVIRLVEDEDRAVRMAAVWALGQIGGQEAIRVLKSLKNSSNETLAEAAKEALDETNLNITSL